MIKTHKIRAEVTIQIFRTGKKIDITNSVKTIKTKKGIEARSGTFQVTLLPTRDERGLSWYHNLSPMDYVEIRATRDPVPGQVPILMRGFIDSINYVVNVDDEGKPARAYSFVGRDYGKLLDIGYIYFLKEVEKDFQMSALPSYQKIMEKWNVDVYADLPNKIIKDLLDVSLLQLEHIQKFYTNAVNLDYVGSQSIPGRMHSFTLTQDDGSVWDFMSFYSNSPWNELYVLDLPEKPALVFRKTPWKDYPGNNLIQGDDETYALTLGDTVKFYPSDITALDLTRTDAETKNYFFTYPIQNLVGNDVSFKAFVLENIKAITDLKANPYWIDADDKDAGLNRFGFRRFENNTEYISVLDKELAASAPLMEQLNLALVDAFRYNSAYEAGSFTLKGSEKWQIGRYLQLDASPASEVKPEYYVVDVSHNLCFETGIEDFSTTLEVTRGTGFLLTRDLANNAESENLRLISGRY